MSLNRFDYFHYKERARKNPYPKRRTLNTEQEILLLQNSTDLMIPRAPFRRLVKEILRKCNSGTRIRNIAIEALQESSELYISTLFEDALLLTGHRQRATLQNSDLQLAKYFTEK